MKYGAELRTRWIRNYNMRFMDQHNKLAILCGGGPAPGLNSVIGAATIRARLEGLDVIELHDCFTIAEIVATEGLGLVEPGTGGLAAEKGATGAVMQQLGAMVAMFRPVLPVKTELANGRPAPSVDVPKPAAVIGEARGTA